MRRILNWSGWCLYWSLLIIAYIVISSAVIKSAQAHSWYSGRNDPVFNSGCCGGSDCAPVDSEWVSEVPEGFRLVMSVEQAKTVNPAATQPVDAIIPWSRVQSPPHAHVGDSQYYACIYPNDRKGPRFGVICFFATPTM